MIYSNEYLAFISNKRNVEGHKNETFQLDLISADKRLSYT